MQNAGPFCLHHGGHERYDFRLKDWTWDTRGNGGQHGIATAAAAFLCRKYDTTPRGIHDEHLDELQAVVGEITGKNLAVRTAG